MTNSQRPQPQQPDGEPVVKIDDKLISDIEFEVGMGTGAWDTVEPEELIAAVLKRCGVVSKADYDRVVEQRDAAQASAEQAEAECAFVREEIEFKLIALRGAINDGLERWRAGEISEACWHRWDGEVKALESLQNRLNASASAALLARLERFEAALKTLGNSVHVPEWAPKLAREALESEW